MAARELEHVTNIDTWRESLLRILAFIFAAGTPLAALVSFPMYLREGLTGLIVVDVLVWLGAIGIIVVSRSSLFRVRASLLLILFGALAASFFASLGPFGPRPAWVVATVALSALLFAFRGVLTTTAASVAVLSAFREILPGVAESWANVALVPAGEWVNYMVNTHVLALGTGLTVAFLVQGLAQTLSKNRDAYVQLRSERAELERAYGKLVEQTAERERLEQSLRRAQKVESLGRLAGGIAHDLNNLLVPIVGYADLITFGLEPDDETRRMLDAMTEATRRARSLCNQMLLFSRDVPPPDESVSMTEILREVITGMESQVPAHTDLTLTVGEDAYVYGNRTALFQVFLNLVQNGLTAMEPEGGELSIELDRDYAAHLDGQQAQTLDRDRDYLCVSVSDTGVGMDAETASRVFEPFFTTRSFGAGTGLGLATCHNIVTAFGGLITVETELEKGSTFRVVLPITEPDTATVALATSELKPKASGRILVVDDNLSTLSTLEKQLIHLGFEVLPAGSGEEALAALRAGRFDLILTDLHMPGMNGLELAAAINEQFPGSRIAMATGYADASAYREAEALGIQVVLAKPFTTTELGNTIARALNHGRPRTPASE